MRYPVADYARDGIGRGSRCPSHLYEPQDRAAGSRAQAAAVPGRTIYARAAAWRERLTTAKGKPLPAEATCRRSLACRAFAWGCGGASEPPPPHLRLLGRVRPPAYHYTGPFLRGYILRGRSRLGHPRGKEWGSERGTHGHGGANWERGRGRVRDFRRFDRAELLSVHRDSAILLAVSPPYLDAITDDLTTAIASTGADRVAIFSAGTRSHPLFEGNLIPCDARLQRHLGGGRVSLNVRCLRHAIERLPGHKLVATDLRHYFTRLLARQPELGTAKRGALDRRGGVGVHPVGPRNGPLC